MICAVCGGELGNRRYRNLNVPGVGNCCLECAMTVDIKALSKRGNPPTRLAARRNAKTRISLERDRQIKLWGADSLEVSKRLEVLVEEVGEVAKAMQEEGPAQVMEELVQVGAVALRIVEDMLLEIDR